MLLAHNLNLNQKYYIIWCNHYYEVKLKKIGTIYDNNQYVFSSRLGDIFLSHSSKTNKWTWATPSIFETKFEAILEIGLQMYRGGHVLRSPYTQEKHIDICLKHIPEKMI